MLHILARFVVKPEHRAAFDAALAANIPQTRAERDCLRFEAYTDAAAQHVVWLVETWRSEDALARHYEQPYARAVLDNLDPWLSEPLTVHRLHAAAYAGNTIG